MENQIQKKVIIITKVEKTLTSTRKQLIKIKDENNFSYQVWPIKKDNTESMAFQFFKTLPMDGVGMNVEISYKEEKGDYNGKPVVYRTIIGMQASAQASLGTKVVRQGQAAEKEEAEEDKWNKISWGKCKHGFLIEAFKKFGDVQFEQNLNLIERQAELWADMSMRKLDKQEEIGLTQEQCDEINLDQPPF